ncbi:MAG: Kae1-associated kinase Bud32 [Candidatus Bathyarchaeia archaeon]
METSRLKLLKKGAEADLYIGELYGRRVVIKRRVQKAYRNPILDSKLRTSRTVREAENMHEAKRVSVPTPTIYLVDKDNATLIMEYIEGVRAKEVLGLLGSDERKKLCEQIGRDIGRLHGASLIHGDLTTSNMILYGGKVFFIDFGLSFHSHNDEDKGVDLHLLKRVLDSTHYRESRECLKHVLLGYREVVGAMGTLRILKKMKEIEYRGRYFSGRV